MEKNTEQAENLEGQIENEKPNEELEEFSVAGMAIKELAKQNERLENANKRQTGIIYALLIMIVLAVGGFLWFLYQYDFATYDIISHDGGNANYIGNDGDIYNGESSGEGSY